MPPQRPFICHDHSCITSSWTTIRRHFSPHCASKRRRRGNQSGESLDGATVPPESVPRIIISLSSFTLDHSVLAISRVIKTEPSGSQTPEPEASDFKKKVSLNNSSFFFALIQQDGLIACYSRGILLRNLPRIRQRLCGSTYNARSSGRYSQGQRVFYNWTHPHQPFLVQ